MLHEIKIKKLKNNFDFVIKLSHDLLINLLNMINLFSYYEHILYNTKNRRMCYQKKIYIYI